MEIIYSIEELKYCFNKYLQTLPADEAFSEGYIHVKDYIDTLYSIQKIEVDYTAEILKTLKFTKDKPFTKDIPLNKLNDIKDNHVVTETISIIEQLIKREINQEIKFKPPKSYEKSYLDKYIKNYKFILLSEINAYVEEFFNLDYLFSTLN